MPRQTERLHVASNRRARHDYAILKTYEAGIALLGDEVKSARARQVSIVEAFGQERDGEIMLHGLHIAEYGHSSRAGHQPRRVRKLLLHRTEIKKILDRVRESGLTLIPLSMYFENGWAKIELAIAKGKREYDKRQAIAERDANREIARAMGRRLKGRRER
jgi:SsrA-binding protein